MKKVGVSMVAAMAAFLFCHEMKGQAFSKGTGILNIGVGFSGYVPYWGTGYSSTPYFNLAYDHSIWQEDKLSIGIGGYLGYRSVWYDYSGSWVDKNGKLHIDEPYRETWTYFTFGIRPTLNYSFNDKAMVYGGLSLGYLIVSYKYSNPNLYVSGSYGSRPGFGVFGGGRYFFSKSFGVFGELGWGMSYLNLGISLRF